MVGFSPVEFVPLVAGVPTSISRIKSPFWGRQSFNVVRPFATPVALNVAVEGVVSVPFETFTSEIAKTLSFTATA